MTLVARNTQSQHSLIRKRAEYGHVSAEEQRALIAALAISQNFNAEEDIVWDGAEPKHSSVLIEGFAAQGMAKAPPVPILILTRSQPLSLLSIAKSNRALSRIRPPIEEEEDRPEETVRRWVKDNQRAIFDPPSGRSSARREVLDADIQQANVSPSDRRKCGRVEPWETPLHRQ